ncbi:unnamed protein product [Schistocephalus solidus]|uniref:RING-type domain-containing protein n=1 Tax=Schistocephalus solidus TaxID=70667 RepID=A0A183SP90_SCHSO|nr:unnamed protein product [Schistocephalus solidus]
MWRQGQVPQDFKDVTNGWVTGNSVIITEASRCSTSPLPYDTDKALVLCSQRKFFEGCLFLWEKNRHRANFQALSLLFYANAQSVGLDKIMPDFQLNPGIKAISVTFDRGDSLYGIYCLCSGIRPLDLSYVEENNLASPLVVLKLLTSVDPSKCCKLGSVKDYLLRYLEAGRQKVEANQAEMQRLREETLRNREIVRQLKTRVKIFQQQKCAVCDQALQPPSIHFLCDHSYHEACFESYSSEDQQCPACTPRNRQLLAEAEKAASADSRSDSQLPHSPFPVRDLLEQLKAALGSQQKPRASPEVAAPLAFAVRSLLGEGAMQSAATAAPRRQATVVAPAVINRPQEPKLQPSARLVSGQPGSLADSGLGSTLPASASSNPFSTPLPASARPQVTASVASPRLKPRFSQELATAPVSSSSRLSAPKDEFRPNLPLVAANPFDADVMPGDTANNGLSSQNGASERNRPEKAGSPSGRENEEDYPTHLNPFA